MALPSTGQISMTQINTELGLTATAPITLNDTAVRNLAGVASGQISLSNFWGKSAGFSGNITTNQTNLDLRTWALANGWNGTSACVVTIASNVYVYSTTFGTPALTITGSFPAGVSLINNGFIMGKGGNGGSTGGVAPQAGGNAINLGVNVTITNNSYIGGGGGGGAAGVQSTYTMGGGGGAGGGTGGTPSEVGTAGAAGAVGASSPAATAYASSTGGGRVFPGTGGQGAKYGTGGNQFAGAAGAGGGGAAYYRAGGTCPGPRQFVVHGAGGGGGGYGAAGGGGVNANICGGASPLQAGAGGSAAAAGGMAIIGATPATLAGGAGGRSVNLNGFVVTWVTIGNRYGAVA